METFAALVVQLLWQALGSYAICSLFALPFWPVFAGLLYLRYLIFEIQGS